jgi:SAM-dependent methyltransferase
MPDPLPLTGERTVPGIAAEAYWFARHEAAYRWLGGRLGPALRGAVVLDAGSGEGYGAALLADAGARLALGLELDAAASRNCSVKYPAVASVRANLVALPVRDRSVDVLVSLQVIEHLWDLPAFLRECARALRPDGVLALTTPNRPVFSPGLARGERPANPFHVEEFDADQLQALLHDNGFARISLHGIGHGDRIAAWERSRGIGLVRAQVALVTGSGPFPPDTTAFAASCTASDFEVRAATQGAQDLVALAVAR